MTEHETLNLDKGLHSLFISQLFYISNENIFYVPILKFEKNSHFFKHALLKHKKIFSHFCFKFK